MAEIEKKKFMSPYHQKKLAKKDMRVKFPIFSKFTADEDLWLLLRVFRLPWHKHLKSQSPNKSIRWIRYDIFDQLSGVVNDLKSIRVDCKYLNPLMWWKSSWGRFYPWLRIRAVNRMILCLRNHHRGESFGCLGPSPRYEGLVDNQNWSSRWWFLF